MSRPVSITTKLAVLFGSATIALISITNLVLFHFVEQQWRSYDQHNLELATEALQLVIGSVKSTVELAGREASIVARLSYNGRLGFAIQDAAGNTVLSTLRQDVPMALLERAQADGETVRWQPRDSQAYDVMVARAAMARGTPLRLVLVLQVTSHLHMARLLGESLLVITLASGLLAALLSWLVSRQGLAPLRRFAAAAGRITASRLGERLDPRESPAELREMADSLNGMLERLQDSFRRMEQFSSDLAHELRTPINNLLGQTQVALSRARTGAEYREVLESNAEEYERLSRMIQDMLFIARADEARSALALQPIELREEVRRVAEFFEPMLEEKHLRFECRGEARANADHQLLGRALGNLLSNALRHAPEGSTVSVEISTDAVAPDLAMLSVTNTGPTIAAEHLPRLFDRFYRVDAARSREGTGLGLAIVRAIAELHGGSVSAQSEWGRTRFTLRLPAAAPAPETGPASAAPLIPALSSPP